MGWREHRLVELREEFVLKALDPLANKAELCREYGISRKTGYKWLARYKREGVGGLNNMSRRPHVSAEQIAGEVVLRIAELRRRRKWGPKKLSVLLTREGLKPPSTKTIGRILKRLELTPVRRRKRRVTVERDAEKLVTEAPNDVWTADFKGWWRTGDGGRFEPLTVRDAFSRYVLCMKHMTSTAVAPTKEVFERLFRQYGLPKVIRVDNGPPFGATKAIGGYTRLSAWWVSLGIRVSFSRPAHPQDNGGHERMHRDVADELELEAAADARTQQRLIDDWVQDFNHVRPHEALAMKTPSQVYRRSPRQFRGTKRPIYPPGFEIRSVSPNGVIKLSGCEIFLSGAFARMPVAIEWLTKQKFRAHFYEMELGTFALPNTKGPPPLASSLRREKSVTPKPGGVYNRK